MADTAQALNPADAGEVDDGLDATERAQFAEMEKVTSEPGASPEPSPAPAPVPDPAAKAGDAPAAADAEDDDEDGEDAPAAAADTAPAPGAAAAPQPKRRVSARKYERSEAARVAAETEARTLRESQARLDERMRILNEALTATAPAPTDAVEEDVEPDAEKDIFAWVAWKKRDDARLRAEIAEEREGRQAQTQEATVANTYIDDARNFAATEPNFAPAYQYLIANRTFELAQYFFGVDLSEAPQKDAQGREISPLNEEQIGRIRQTIAAEERQLATEAIDKKQSPAKRVFALAKARGYRPAAPAAKPAGDAPAAGNGGTAAVPAVPGALNASAAAPRVEEEIARIKAGSEAARSLSSGGGAPPNPLTPEKLANMPQEEFDALIETLSPAEQRQMFGA